MRASTHLAVRTENNVAVFTMPLHPGWMMFVGASCKSSANPGVTCEAVTVTVPTGEKAVVVIRTTYCRNKQEGSGFTDVMCVIPITWEDGKMLVDLERPFVSSPDRLLQVNKDCHIVVTAEDQKFISASPTEKEKFVGEGYRVVDDPGLLLRFAIGQASLEDLEAAATLDKRKQAERSFAIAQAAFEKTLAELAETKFKLVQSKAELKETKLQLEAEGRVCVGCENDRHELSMTVGGIVDILKNNHPHYKTRFSFLPWMKVANLRKYLRLKHQ